MEYNINLIVLLTIVFFVGSGGIIALILNQRDIAIACFSGLIGYLSHRYESKDELTNNYNSA
jgi:hypothetical protein